MSTPKRQRTVLNAFVNCSVCPPPPAPSLEHATAQTMTGVRMSTPNDAEATLLSACSVECCVCPGACHRICISPAVTNSAQVDEAIGITGVGTAPLTRTYTVRHRASRIARHRADRTARHRAPEPSNACGRTPSFARRPHHLCLFHPRTAHTHLTSTAPVATQPSQSSTAAAITAAVLPLRGRPLNAQ